MKEKFHLLSEVPFLADLSQQDRIECAHEFHWEIYPKGAVLIEAGKKPAAVYILEEGKLDSEDKVLGMVSLVTGKAATETIRSLEPVRLLTIKAEDFARILLRWPQIYGTIIGNLTDNLAETHQMLSASRYKEVLRSAIQLTRYKDKFYGIWGSVKTTHEVERLFKKLQQTEGHLLIRGERGTGRQMVAWYAHQQLFGEAAPFVVLNGQRFEQQWGYLLKEEKKAAESSYAAFTFEDIAAGGTLFIQEIDQITPELQIRLAQVLGTAHHSCLVIGSIQEDNKHKDPQLMPELAACFEHSYSIAPLRERKRDIPIIAQGIVESLAQKHQRKVPVLTSEATQLLLSHNYRQGNVTELIQVMERAFFLADQDVIGLEQIFFGPTAEKIGSKINLLQWGFFKSLFKSRKLLHSLQWISAVLFLLLIVGLVFLPQLPLTMKVFVLVWGLWWPSLAILSPLLGRLWCTFCPFSKIMEFVQDRYHPKRPLPALFVKYDYLMVSVLFALIFWAEIFTGMRSHMLFTALLLLVIQGLAIIVSVLYPRHAWCRHFCPLGGFIGTASIGSLLEVRADAAVCLNKCTTFDCYVGRDGVKGCPMSQHLPYLDNNLDCKLCFKCVSNCQHENVQVNLRVPAREVWHLTRVNQGYAVFIGMLMGILFPIMVFEPLHGSMPPSQWQLWFTLTYLLAALLGGALGWWLGKPFKTKAASKRIKLVFAFIPLIIGGHIVYQIGYIPGINDLFLGMGYYEETGMQTLFITAKSLGYGLAMFTGILLTAITVGLTLHQYSKAKNINH